MRIKEVQDVLNIFKKNRVSIIIIFSLLFIPNVIVLWTSPFNKNQTITIIFTILICIIWIFAIWSEINYRRYKHMKDVLYSYLERHGPYRSFNHIYESLNYSEKQIRKLIDLFEELNYVPMKKYGHGVGISGNNK